MNRNRGVCVSGPMIRHKSIDFSTDPMFTASPGWLDRFLNRKSLALGRITTSGRDLPANRGQIIKNFKII